MGSKNKTLTYKEIKDYINGKDGNGCKLLTTEEEFEIEKIKQGVRNSILKLKIKCRCSNTFITNINTFKTNNKKQCNECGYEITKNKNSLDYKDIKYFIEVKSNSGCKLLSEKYKNVNSNLKLQCGCGDIFYVTFDNFKNNNKRQCNKCGNRYYTDYESVKNFIEIDSLSSCKLLTPKNEYKDQKTKLKLQCKCGNPFITNFDTFKNSHQVCSECLSKIISFNLKIPYSEIKLNISKFECEIITKEQDYIDTKQNIEIRCKCGNIFVTCYNNFMTVGKNRCNECTRKALNKLEYDKIINIIQKDGKYKLLTSEFHDYKELLKIQCNTCNNIFYESLANFKSALIPCPKCRLDNLRKTIKRGEFSSAWRGGKTLENDLIRKSWQYKEWHKAVFERDDYTCQCCGQHGGKIEAHHIENFSNHEESRFDVNNGITLCKKCHSSNEIGSFHNVYGVYNNTKEQLEEYIILNNKNQKS